MITVNQRDTFFNHHYEADRVVTSGREFFSQARSVRVRAVDVGLRNALKSTTTAARAIDRIAKFCSEYDFDIQIQRGSDDSDSEISLWIINKHHTKIMHSIKIGIFTGIIAGRYGRNRIGAAIRELRKRLI